VSFATMSAFALGLAAAAAMPGPATIAVAARALAGGPAAALPLGLGLVLGDLAWCALSIAGADAMLVWFPMLAFALRWVGVLWLGVIAWRLWRPTPPAAGPGRADDRRGVRAGLAIAAANPKTMLFYLALLPAWLDAGTGARGFARAALVIVPVYGSVLVAWATIAASARRACAVPPDPRQLQRLSGIAVAFAALLVAIG
jgi:threonine/homoserine/homoserine lactone efflux protein